MEEDADIFHSPERMMEEERDDEEMEKLIQLMRLTLKKKDPSCKVN